MRFTVLTVCSLFAAAAVGHTEEADFSTTQEDYDNLVAGRNRDAEKDTLYDENRRALRREASQQLQLLQHIRDCCPGTQGYGSSPCEDNLYNEPWTPQPYQYTYPQ